VHRVRTVSLAVLLAVLGLLGAAPAASAAPTVGVTWDTYGSSSVRADGSVAVCAAGGGFQQGQTLKIQVARNGEWGTARFYDAAELRYRSCVYPRPTELVRGAGTYILRATTWSAGGARAEKQIRLTFTPVDVWPGVRATGYTTTTASDRAVRVTVDAVHGQQVDLQRRSGSSWRTVERAAAPRSGSSATVRLAVPARAGSTSYRVVVRATPWTTTATTKTFSIHQTDTARFGGYIAEARRYMARYCPSTPISVDTPSVAGAGQSGRIGRAYASWSWGDGGGSLSTRIELRSGLTGDQLRHTALHECAHVVQYRAVVDGRRDAEEQRAWQLYPAVGTEGQADCMAYLHVRAARPLYYVTGCSAAQLRDAERMWQTYGGKYQAATYRW